VDLSSQVLAFILVGADRRCTARLLDSRIQPVVQADASASNARLIAKHTRIRKLHVPEHPH
jgi:hypothetical protein